MTRLLVAPIVEGHGEAACIRRLLERIGEEQLDGARIEAVKAFRKPRSKLVLGGELSKIAQLACSKLKQAAITNDRLLLLVLLDADDDCPAEMAPRLLTEIRGIGVRAACVMANKEFESWFVAAAESLRAYLDFADPAPEFPERARAGKKWVERRFARPGAARYSETVDQPAMTATMDLELCRRRSPSFDKLCRDLAAALAG